MARLGSVRWSSGLLALALTGCGQYSEEIPEKLQQKLVNGVPVTDNAGDTVLIELPTGFGSGVIWENEGSVATVVTAAHVIEDHVENALRRQVASSGQVQRSDGGSIVETVDAQKFVPHPASTTIFLLDRGNAHPMPTQMLDLGVIITDAFTTARNNVEPSTLTLGGVLGEQLQIQGYGPNDPAEDNQDDQPSARVLRNLAVTCTETTPLRSLGKATRVNGSAVLTQPTAGPGTGTLHGDSGGPLFDDLGTLVSTHKGTTPDNKMASLRIADFAEWIEAVRNARGVVVNGRFSNAPHATHEVDQLIVNPGQQWHIHVEKFDGSRLVRDVPRGAGIGVFESVVELKQAFFDSNKLADALVELQTLPSGFRLVELLNPGDALSTPSPRLLSTSAYSSVTVTRLNGDDVDDLVAERVDGETEQFYGSTQNGLEGPFGPDTFRSCRNAGSRRATACGGNNADGSCSCSPACANSGGSNCCSDAVSVCSNSLEDEFLRSIASLQIEPSIAPNAASGAQPVVRVTATGAAEVTGVLLDEHWVLTSRTPLAVGRNFQVFQQTATGEKQLTTVQSPFSDPESGLGLLRVSGAVLPAGFRMEFFEGTPDVLASESSVRAFGRLAGQTRFSQASFPAAAIQAFNAGAFQIPFSYDLLLSGPLLAQEFSMPPGAPVFSEAGKLVSLTLSTIDTQVSRDGNPAIPAKLHQQEPLVAVNAEPEDDRPSARYFAEQVRARDAQRDFDQDGTQDLWILQRPTDTAFPELSRLSITVPLDGTPAQAGTETSAAPAMGDDGNWTVAGRAKIGSKSVGIVWREIDSGAIQIWQMSGNQIVRTLDFSVAPPWQIRAIDDINGDGIGDWLWSNTVLNLSFYWIMNDWDLFDDAAELAQLEANPSLLLQDSNWFNGMQLIDENGDPAFELMAADHFPAPDALDIPSTGPEQAATDLLWQRVAGDETVLWSMALEHRLCEELVDPLLLASCVDAGGDSIRTFEMTRSSPNIIRPPEWRLAGTADYNRDGQADLVWHARELAQPSEDNQVQIWLSQPSGVFAPRQVRQGSSPLVVDIVQGREVLVR